MIEVSSVSTTAEADGSHAGCDGANNAGCEGCEDLADGTEDFIMTQPTECFLQPRAD